MTIFSKISTRDAMACGPSLDDRNYDPPGSSISNVMHRINSLKVQEELRAWLGREWKDIPLVALTFTFSHKQPRLAASGNVPVHDIRGKKIADSKDSMPNLSTGKRGDIEGITRNLHKKLSYMAYGKAARRYGKRLGMAVVYEGFNRGHPHCHAILQIPASDTRAFFETRVRRVLKAHPCIGVFEISTLTSSEGWIDYMTKLKDKGDLQQDFDCLAPPVPESRHHGQPDREPRDPYSPLARALLEGLKKDAA